MIEIRKIGIIYKRTFFILNLKNRIKYRYVEPVLLLYMLAVSAEYAFVQELINLKLCANKFNLNDTESINRLCEKKSDTFKKYEDEYLNIFQWYNSIFYFFPLITTTVLSSWSDLFGRRFTLILPALFSLLVQIIFLYASTELLDQNIIIHILIGALLSGVSGSSSTIISSTHSYLTNHVDKANMTKRLTILEACIFIGGFLGYNLTSLILKYRPNDKFLIGFPLIAFIHLLIIFYVKFYLDDKDERTIKFGNLIKFNHFLDTFKVLTKQRPNFRRTKLFMLYYCALSSSFALSVQQILFFTYLKSYFSWSTDRYSKLQGAISLMNGLSLILFFPVIQWCLTKLFNLNSLSNSNSNILDTQQSQPTESISEQPINEMINQTGQNSLDQTLLDKIDVKIDTIIVALGFFSKFLGLGLLGLIANDEYMYFVPLLFAFNEFAMPGIRSMISKTVDDDEKGKAFGLLSFTRNVCYFTGSFLFKHIYSITKNFYKGLTFELISILQIIAILLIR